METLLLPPDIQLLKKASSGTPIFENVSSLKSAESGENDGQLFEEVLKKKQTKNTNSVPDQPTGKEIDFELKGIAQQVLTIEPGYAKPGGLQKEAVSKSDNSTPLKIAMLGNNTVLDEKLNIPHSTGSNQSQKPGISIAIAKSHSKDAVRPERNFVKSGHVQSEVLSTFSAKGKTSPFNLQLEPGTTQNAKIIRENKGIAHSQNPESQIKVVKNLESNTSPRNRMLHLTGNSILQVGQNGVLTNFVNKLQKLVTLFIGGKSKKGSNISTDNGPGLNLQSLKDLPTPVVINQSTTTNSLTRRTQNSNNGNRGKTSVESSDLNQTQNKSQENSSPNQAIKNTLLNLNNPLQSNQNKLNSGKSTNHPVLEPSELVKQIKIKNLEGVNQLTLQLKPEALGKGLITFRSDNGKISLDFFMKSLSAKHAIEGESGRIRESLIAAGFQNVVIEVRSGDNSAITQDILNEDEENSGSNKNNSKQNRSGFESNNPKESRDYHPKSMGYNTFDIEA